MITPTTVLFCLLQRLSNGSIDPDSEVNRVIELQETVEKQNGDLTSARNKITELTNRVAELEEALASAQKDLIKTQESGVKLQRDLREVSCEIRQYPTETRHSPDAGSMLGRRRRRRANIEPALDQRLVFAGYILY